ncbi:MAG: hypothetical protein HOP08_12880 [Cyclobacteriaceae bacterium]|nr:hypothetical protein [Cyclobacteriaceae bacterium]
MRNHLFHILLSVVLTVTFSETVFAQSRVRESIDQERAENLSFYEEKTFEKARGFVRRDSTYYVGHMFQGAYLFFRANDELGFNQAITPLKKALRLMEKDFDKQLRTRSNNYYDYSAVYRYHNDYGLIAYMLETSYQNIEMPDKAMEVLYHVRDYNFQLEQSINAYNTMAWIFHRNRVYTSKQFPFLKNSVKENVAMANKYLDSALMKNYNDMSMNTGLFDPSFLNRQYLGTFHYKAMIYDYKLEIDSANFFYNELIKGDAYSSNNYAEFKLAMGEFSEADDFFKEAEQKEYGGEKNTKEYFYMRGTLNTYRAHPEEADSLLRRVLKEQGSTPGYGWHAIGLARALHYEGLTDESQEYNNKASRFQELHIGTTWGQEQYNLAVSSLNYLNQLQFEKEYFFENDQWWFWFNPVNWYKWIKYSLEIHHYKMLLASLIAENPEREQVIYTIFSPENLMSFDEVSSVIDGFGNEYFIEVYKRLLETDKRPRLKKYFRYFLGKLYLAEGNKSEAIKYFQQVLQDRERGNEYQRMLYARIYEGMANASSNDNERNQWTREFYETFPQLVPFSDLKMSFQLNLEGEETSDLTKDITSEMKNCSVNFNGGEGSPVVSIRFSETTEGLDINYIVESADKSRVLRQGVLQILKDETENAGKTLAYSLFGINKKKVGEKPEPAKPAV